MLRKLEFHKRPWFRLGDTTGTEKGLPSRGVGIRQVDGAHRKTVSSLEHPQNQEKKTDNDSGLATPAWVPASSPLSWRAWPECCSWH